MIDRISTSFIALLRRRQTLSTGAGVSGSREPGECPVCHVPLHYLRKLFLSMYDVKEEAERREQEYREQGVFECWLPKLSSDDVKLFEGL